MKRELSNWKKGTGLGHTLRNAIALVGCALGVAACGGALMDESEEGALAVARQEISAVRIPNGTQTIWAHFTAAYPGSTPDYTIKNEVVRLIDSQVAPGTIKIAVHKLGADVKDALVRAARVRGVVVKAAVTGQISGDPHVIDLQNQLAGCAGSRCMRPFSMATLPGRPGAPLPSTRVPPSISSSLTLATPPWPVAGRAPRRRAPCPDARGR